MTLARIGWLFERSACRLSGLFSKSEADFVVVSRIVWNTVVMVSCSCR